MLNIFTQILTIIFAILGIFTYVRWRTDIRANQAKKFLVKCCKVKDIFDRIRLKSFYTIPIEICEESNKTGIDKKYLYIYYLVQQYRNVFDDFIDESYLFRAEFGDIDKQKIERLNKIIEDFFKKLRVALSRASKELDKNKKEELDEILLGWGVQTDRFEHEIAAAVEDIKEICRQYIDRPIRAKYPFLSKLLLGF